MTKKINIFFVAHCLDVFMTCCAVKLEVMHFLEWCGRGEWSYLMYRYYNVAIKL